MTKEQERRNLIRLSFIYFFGLFTDILDKLFCVFIYIMGIPDHAQTNRQCVSNGNQVQLVCVNAIIFCNEGNSGTRPYHGNNGFHIFQIMNFNMIVAAVQMQEKGEKRVLKRSVLRLQQQQCFISDLRKGDTVFFGQGMLSGNRKCQ